ncbi:Biopolymer transport protein ExbD/TolR [hydrothermal vent metagenome]|uniref:Biopolymer transport protein ExbD/TolR n=1 Tax=hydrothermal vent metagenome TaxID=652676 RepID=A0A3B1BQM3_9ZZZZ
MSRIRHRHRRKPASVELNITAFMNLMVVLVPFLLMTAVFSQLTILQLNLPDGAGKAGSDKAGFQIQIIINKNALLVADSKGGLIKRIPVKPQDQSGQQYLSLRKTLKQIKARLPDKTDATILSQVDTPYEILVRVMDTVRVYPALVGGKTISAELFPDISIGDAAKKK